MVFLPQLRDLLSAAQNPQPGNDDPETIKVDRGYLLDFMQSVVGTLTIAQTADFPAK